MKIQKAGYRITVTGSRGKSGVVRLLHTAFCACGIRTRTRLTGVLPRELHQNGETPLLRPAGANIAELKWWLGELPDDTEAVITENSAVSPELQSAAPRLLMPSLTVFTNIRPDHAAFWGETEEDAAAALSGALPDGGAVVIPADVAAAPVMRAVIKKKRLTVHEVTPLEDRAIPAYKRINIALAAKVCSLCGLDMELAMPAMLALGPDIADSQVLECGGGRLAFAFSINDVESTSEYMTYLGWDAAETTLIYNHRSDRADRLRSFADWITNGWRETVIIGDRPLGALAPFWRRLSGPEELGLLIAEKGQCFGCGNVVYGTPLLFKLALEDGRFTL